VTNTLEANLLEFDGKAISILSEAIAAHHDSADYLKQVIHFSTDKRPYVADGATWILKFEAENGLRVGSDRLIPLIANLEAIKSWPAQLHLCQAVDAFEFTEKQAEQFYHWAASMHNHERPFNRAWSLHAQVVIAAKFAKFRKSASLALVNSEADVAASVRARVRNLKKLYQL